MFFLAPNTGQLRAWGRTRNQSLVLNPISIQIRARIMGSKGGGVNIRELHVIEVTQARQYRLGHLPLVGCGVVGIGQRAREYRRSEYGCRHPFGQIVNMWSWKSITEY